jgi:hypothetical protein
MAKSIKYMESAFRSTVDTELRPREKLTAQVTPAIER